MNYTNDPPRNQTLVGLVVVVALILIAAGCDVPYSLPEHNSISTSNYVLAFAFVLANFLAISWPTHKKEEEVNETG